MTNIFNKFTNKYFGESLGFRARIFNAVMFIVSGIAMIVGVNAMLAVRGESLAGVPAFACSIVIACLIWYANKSGKYQFAYWAVTIVLFMGQGAAGFFLTGGYHLGGTFAGFMFNAALAAFLFEGKKSDHRSTDTYYRIYRALLLRVLSSRKRYKV